MRGETGMKGYLRGNSATLTTGRRGALLLLLVIIIDSAQAVLYAKENRKCKSATIPDEPPPLFWQPVVRACLSCDRYCKDSTDDFCQVCFGQEPLTTEPPETRKPTTTDDFGLGISTPVPLETRKQTTADSSGQGISTLDPPETQKPTTADDESVTDSSGLGFSGIVLRVAPFFLLTLALFVGMYMYWFLYRKQKNKLRNDAALRAAEQGQPLRQGGDDENEHEHGGDRAPGRPIKQDTGTVPEMHPLDPNNIQCSSSQHESCV